MFGVDVEDGALDRRTWRWLELRVADLVETPSSRLARELGAHTPPPGDTPH